MLNNLTPITLQGATIRLEPLRHTHAEDLFQSGADRTIWTYMPIGGFDNLPAVHAWIDKALAAQAAKTELPFAIILNSTNHAIGSTRYLDIRHEHRALEIGHTWLSPDFQRTAANTEAKYLLLTHAFETLGCHRVQLKTDARNTRSQRAIERIGGVMEGAHRRHMITWDGHIRDTIYYSILDTEWPKAKQRIQQMLARQSI